MPIAAEVPLELGDDSPLAVTRALAEATRGVAAALDRIRPDLLVVLGDRYEVLAAAQAAMVLNVPIAHLHGGETTEGAMDEAIRHAVTKMSHLHFVAAEPYRDRVIQLGEDPARVWTVGALGLDAIARLPELGDDELRARLEGLDVSDGVLLVTYHPATLDTAGPEPAVRALLEALDRAELPVVVTKANADPGGLRVNALVEAWAAGRADVRVVASLGQQAYLSLMRRARAVVGNSSSGIIEAPALGVPTVNLGDRQHGRLRSPSILDVPEEAGAVAAAIAQATGGTWAADSRYGTPGASDRIREVVLTHPLRGLLKKTFHDRP